MKNYGFLIILVILLAFFAGQLTYQFKSDRVPDKAEIIEVSNALNEIVQTVQPFNRIDLNAMYRQRDYWELFRDKNYQSKTFSSNINDCDSLQIQSIEDNSKYSIWLNFKCNNNIELPLNFFNRKPYISPSGSSYAYMAYQLNSKPFITTSWLMSKLHYFKPIELRDIPIELPAQFNILSEFNENELSLLISNEKMFQTNENIFLKTGDLQYYVIKRSRLNKILSASLFEISPSLKECSFSVGNICWKYRRLSFLKQLTNKSYTAFYLSLFILIIILIFVINKAKGEYLEQEKKKHAFRILTHELRTPISSLLLLIERLTKTSRNLTSEQQTDILELEKEIYRLKSLASKSSSILQSDKIKDFDFSYTQTNNIGTYIQDWFNEDIKIKELDSHINVIIDLYWFKTCLFNIIENAKKYGVAPIYISIHEKNKHVFIHIVDQGKTNFKNLNQLLKSPRMENKGLGLGLTIVKKTLKEMNIKLKFDAKPTTTFTLVLKGIK